VTAVVRRAGSGAPWAKREINVDLLSPVAAPDAGRQDAAVFLSQSPRYREHPGGSEEVVRVNLGGLVQALEMARRSGVDRFLYGSSGSVYGVGREAFREEDPLLGTGVYAITKRCGEELAREWSRWFPVVSMRFFALYGPGQRGRMVAEVVEAVRAGRAVPVQPREFGELEPAGFATSPCLVGDAARAVRRLCEGDQEGPVNIAGPEAVTIREIADCVGRRLGRSVKYEVGAKPRRGDLVARIDRLRDWTGIEPVRFEVGVETLIGSGSRERRGVVGTVDDVAGEGGTGQR